MPAHPSTPASTHPGPTDLAGPGDLADLEALAGQLHQRELPALLLIPPGKLPCVDTGLPQGMAPGLRIQAQAGMFFTWPDARPIAPSNQPATAATIIARQLRPNPPQLVTTGDTHATGDPPEDRAHLEQLAAALSERGYEATVITPAPCLALRIPGTTLPQMIHTTDGHLWWNTAQTIAPASHTTHAAETITWALRAQTHQPPTHDTTSPLTTPPSHPTPPHTSGSGQQC